ncbi:MAG TPA: transposase [Polyangiaceae bacterium]
MQLGVDTARAAPDARVPISRVSCANYCLIHVDSLESRPVASSLASAHGMQRPRARKSRGGSSSEQLRLQFTSPNNARRQRGEPPRGGARTGAGRPKSADSGVPHRVRPELSKHHPLHLTLHVRPEAKGLRQRRVFCAVRGALAAAREQFGFRLVHYSVQGNHIHLIAEANDRTALTRGMQGLTIRVALAVNRARSRRGRVFRDRYHARQLRSPLAVRRALLYVLRNDRHHLTQRGLSLPSWHRDPCSSARQFSGWKECVLLRLARQAERGTEAAHHDKPAAVAPRTFLLRFGWQRYGLLGLEERAGEQVSSGS